MADRYWVGGAGSWTATGPTFWSDTSGGANNFSVPASTDDVFFDAGSDSGAPFTVTHNSAGAVCRSLTVSGLDQTMTLSGTASITLSGGLTFPATNFVKGGSGALLFNGATTRTITTNGVTLSGSVTINAASSTITLGSALTLSAGRTITFTAGTLLDFAGYNVTCGTFTSTLASTRSLTLGTGTLTCTDGTSTAAFTLTGATNLTLSAASSTILMTGATAKTFGGNGYTFGVLKNAGAGAMTIAGSNTFSELGNTVQPCTVSLTSGTTQTITTFSLQGTAGNLVTLNAVTAGSAATLSKASGTVNASYLSIKDNTPTGGARWVASNGTNVDQGNTLGWEFILGQSATGSVGDVTVIGGISVTTTLTGVEASGALGTGTVVAKATVAPTGTSASGSLGAETVVAKATVASAGVSVTGALGEAAVGITANVDLSGVSAASALGDVAVGLGAIANVSGEFASGSIGDTSIAIAQTILAASVYATGYVSSPLVWGPIDTSQTANWVEINT